jgi:hypothetical protein
MDGTTPSRHDNQPPLPERLALDYQETADEVQKIAERANALPRKIENEEDLSAVAPVIRDATTLMRRVEDARKKEKEPHLEAGRQVDTFFKGMDDRLNNIKTVFTKLADAYQRQKVEDERRRREEEARKLREEEQRKLKEAEDARRAATVAKRQDEAAELARRAAEAEAAAAEQAKEIARTRTESGVVAGAKTVRNFRIVNYDQIPLDKLRPYIARDAVEKAVRAYMGFAKGAEDLPGVEFYDDIKSTFR